MRIKAACIFPLVVSAFAFGGCSKSPVTEASSKPIERENITIKAALVIEGDWELPENVSCSIMNDINDILRGDTKYLDGVIQERVKVEVNNSQGEIVKIGNLGEPKTVSKDNPSFSDCAFSTTLTEVPISDFYTISIGDQEQTFSIDEIKQEMVKIYTDVSGAKALVKK